MFTTLIRPSVQRSLDLISQFAEAANESADRWAGQPLYVGYPQEGSILDLIPEDGDLLCCSDAVVDGEGRCLHNTTFVAMPLDVLDDMCGECGYRNAHAYDCPQYNDEYLASLREDPEKMAAAMHYALHPEGGATKQITRWCDCVVSYYQPRDVLKGVSELKVLTFCGVFHANEAEAMRDLRSATRSFTDMEAGTW